MCVQLMTLAVAELFFQTVTRGGATVDAGVMRRSPRRVP
jgi:hypothetical protein